METFKPLTTSNRKSYKVYLTAIMDIVEKVEIEEDIRISNKGVK